MKTLLKCLPKNYGFQEWQRLNVPSVFAFSVLKGGVDNITSTSRNIVNIGFQLKLSSLSFFLVVIISYLDFCRILGRN